MLVTVMLNHTPSSQRNRIGPVDAAAAGGSLWNGLRRMAYGLTLVVAVGAVWLYGLAGSIVAPEYVHPGAVLQSRTDGNGTSADRSIVTEAVRGIAGRLAH